MVNNKYLQIKSNIQYLIKSTDIYSHLFIKRTFINNNLY